MWRKKLARRIERPTYRLRTLFGGDESVPFAPLNRLDELESVVFRWLELAGRGARFEQVPAATMDTFDRWLPSSTSAGLLT